MTRFSATAEMASNSCASSANSASMMLSVKFTSVGGSVVNAVASSSASDMMKGCGKKVVASRCVSRSPSTFYSSTPTVKCVGDFRFSHSWWIGTRREMGAFEAKKERGGDDIVFQQKYKSHSGEMLLFL